jgi:hypothetical protein
VYEICRNACTDGLLFNPDIGECVRPAIEGECIFK